MSPFLAPRHRPGALRQLRVPGLLLFLLGLAGCGHGGPEPNTEVAAADSARTLPTHDPATAPDSTAAGGVAGAPPLTAVAPDSTAQERLAARVRALVAANDFAAARALVAGGPAGPADPAEAALSASLLAYVELKGDDVARAATPAGAAWRADSTNAVRLNNYGITRLQAGDVPGAERAFREALRRDADLPGPYYNLAIISAFYRMDVPEGRRWFAHYQARATEDPDRLDQALAAAGADSTEGERP